MNPALKHLDPIMGVDIHLVQLPAPGPPVPIPHPYIGMILDPMDYLPVVGATVFVNGLPRATAGSSGLATPPHIPIGGMFIKPPTNESQVFMGSSTVTAEGEPMAYSGLPVLSCSDVGIPAPPRAKKKSAPTSLFLPTSVAMAIPSGPPVLVGGAPTVALTSMAMGAASGKAMKAVGKGAKSGAKSLAKAIRKAQNNKLGKAISKKAHAAADAAMDRVPSKVSAQTRNRVHRAVCTVTGHPVDVASGKMFTEAEDFRLGETQPFVWERTYYTTSAETVGSLGPGWHHNHEVFLLYRQGKIELRLPDGRDVTFSGMGVGTQVENKEENLILTRPQPDLFVLEDGEGTRHALRPYPARPGLHLLAESRFRGGRTVGYRYDAEGRLRSIVDAGGRRLDVVWRGNRIESVRGPHPYLTEMSVALVAYKYDAQGRLIAAFDGAGETLRYRYRGDGGLMFEERHRDGLGFYFEYDQEGPAARCIRTWGDDGVFDHRLTYDLAKRTTTVTNSLGHQTVYAHDGAVVHREVDALGYETRTARNALRQVTEEVDAAGETTQYRYDTRGNRTEIISADGSSMRMTYDARDRAVGVVDRLGGRWRFAYDDEDRLVEETDSTGATTRYTYSGKNLIQVVEADGATTKYGWGPDGELSSITDPTGATTKLHRDRLGRIVEIIDPEGAIERRAYDGCGRVTSVIRPDGQQVTFRYDAEGRLIHQSDGRDEIALTYFGMGQPLSRTVNGRTRRLRYDTEGQVVGFVDEFGRSNPLSLDARGDVVEETTVHGVRYGYSRNPRGEISSVEHPGGRTTRIERDPVGRVTSVVRPDGTEERYAYRADGALREAQAGGQAVILERDVLGRVVRENQGAGWVSNEYTPTGARRALSSSLGLHQVFERDAAGRVKGLEAHVQGERFDRPPSSAAFSARLHRNRRGQEVGRRFLDFDVHLEHDVLGELRGIEVHRPGARGPERLLRRKVEPRAYAEFELEKSIREGLARMAEAPFSHLATAVLPDGVAEMALPSEVMSLYREESPADWRFGKPGSTVEGRDPQGRMSRYVYDIEGRVIERRAPAGTWTYRYDGAGRLKQVRRGDGKTVELGYDPFGRCILRRDDRLEVRFVWDGDRPVHELRTPVAATGGVRVASLRGREVSSPRREREDSPGTPNEAGRTRAQSRGGVTIRGLPGQRPSGGRPGGVRITGVRDVKKADVPERVRGRSPPGQRPPGSTMPGPSAKDRKTTGHRAAEVRTWLFHPDVFELWGTLEHERDGKCWIDSTRYAVGDHVGLPAALLDSTGEVTWQDSGWESRRGCFVAGTLIATPSGFQPIETLHVGDQVLTAKTSSDLVSSKSSVEGSSTSGDSAISQRPRSRVGQAAALAASVLAAAAMPSEALAAVDGPATLVPASSSLDSAEVTKSAWQAVRASFAPDDDDEGHIYNVELLGSSDKFDSKTGFQEGERFRLALDELEVEGWATVQSVRAVSANPLVSSTFGRGNSGLSTADSGEDALPCLDENRTAARRIVTMTLNHQSNDVYELSFDGVEETLRGTGAHPLYSLDRDDWVRIRDLQVGERLQTAEGAVTVEALEKVRRVYRVYNLEVEGDHEYLVGEAGVRAHNAACGQAVVEDKKWDYLFGKASGSKNAAHNKPRTAQNAQQLGRVGIHDTPEGRKLLQDHFDEVVQDQRNVTRTWTNEHGVFETRESLFSGPGGFLKLDTTWQVMDDGSRRLTTLIPRGGP